MNRKQFLQQGIKLASEGKLDDALRRFNEGLRLADKNNDEPWVGLLYKNAGLIHEQKGNLNKAKQCYLRALKYGKVDPYIYLSLADLSERLAQITAARGYFARCNELAVQKEDVDLLELLSKRGQPGTKSREHT